MHRKAVALLSILLLTIACGHARTVPVEQHPQLVATQPGTAQLPLPGALKRSASVAPVNSSGRVALGTDTSLPISLNTAPKFVWGISSYMEAYQLQFGPQITESFGNGIPASYQGYRFKPDGYSGPLEFHLGWTAPPQAADLHFALADFENQAWRFFTTADPYTLVTEDAPQYHSLEGEIFLVLFVFNHPATLHWVRLGGNVPPFAGVLVENTVTPPGPVQFDCTLDAFDVDGELVKIEFDFDGDGVYEVDNELATRALPTFDSPGLHPTLMRVTDDSGLSAVASVEITVNDWQSEVITNGAISLEIDGNDILHSWFRTNVDDSYEFYYLFNDGSGWQEELIDPSLLVGTGSWSMLVLDRNDTPTFFFTGVGDRLVQRTSGGWQLYPAPLYDFAFPDSKRISIEFDSANRPHIAAGSVSRGGPGVPDDDSVRYWMFDGSDWIIKLDTLGDSNYFGLALDSADIPYIGFEIRAADYSLPVMLFKDPRFPNWTQEFIAGESLWNTAMVMDHAGMLHVISDSGGYYFRDQPGWWLPGPDPGIEHDANIDVIIDPAGALALVRSQSSRADVLQLEGGFWLAEELMSGGSGRLVAPHLRMKSDGEMHVLGSVRIDDERFLWIRPRNDPPWRRMHYWK